MVDALITPMFVETFARVIFDSMYAFTQPYIVGHCWGQGGGGGVLKRKFYKTKQQNLEDLRRRIKNASQLVIPEMMENVRRFFELI